MKEKILEAPPSEGIRFPFLSTKEELKLLKKIKRKTKSFPINPGRQKPKKNRKKLFQKGVKYLSSLSFNKNPASKIKSARDEKEPLTNYLLKFFETVDKKE